MGFVKLSWLSLWFWGHLESLWEDYALPTGSVGADGAQEQCWDGWVPSGQDDVRKIGEGCCRVFFLELSKMPSFPQFADS